MHLGAFLKLKALKKHPRNSIFSIIFFVNMKFYHCFTTRLNNSLCSSLERSLFRNF